MAASTTRSRCSSDCRAVASLRDTRARDGAASAYSVYLDMFNTPPATISLILASLDHFYVFLGLGRITMARPAAASLG